MGNDIFKSNRHFTVFDFVISHGELLLRASKDDDNSKNIDIIFFGVRYIQLFISLSGVSIKLVNDNKNLVNYDIVKSFLNNEGNHLFEIETKGEKFYVGASYFKVYENDLEFNETSLGIAEAKGRERKLTESN